MGQRCDLCCDSRLACGQGLIWCECHLGDPVLPDDLPTDDMPAVRRCKGGHLTKGMSKSGAHIGACADLPVGVTPSAVSSVSPSTPKCGSPPATAFWS